MAVRPIITITHAAFAPARRVTLARLLHQLAVEAPGIPVVVARDTDKRGSLWCWERAMRLGLEAPEVTHVVWLPDDAILCKDFGRLLAACIEARPNDVFDCYLNHAQFALTVEEAGACWYSTPDGYVGLGGVMPRALLEQHQAWRIRVGLSNDYSNDGGVNLWAMHAGRRIYKTAFTLVQHDRKVPSLDGNGDHEARVGARWMNDYRSGVLFDVGNLLGRTWLAPEEHMPGHRQSCVDLGLTYRGNVWNLAKRLPAREWDLDLMYATARGGPVDETPHVYISTPLYGESAFVKATTDPTRAAAIEHLLASGINVTKQETVGESLVTRVRQRIVHQFLLSPATHLLFWDLDIECLTPECVTAMVRLGLDVVAGACPFKDATRRVVCNLFPEDVESGRLVSVGGAIRVRDAGTGFMLISRAALIRIMKEHPELLHESLNTSDLGAPLWATFDCAVVDRVYLSEDYRFCRLWQELGGTVYVYVPAKFRHWGHHGYEASLENQLGLTVQT